MVLKNCDSDIHQTNVQVRSKTGTGKTLAFVIAAVETILKMPKAPSNRAPILIVAPSRELAAQIQAEAKPIMDAHGLKSVLVVGGEDRAKQCKKIVYQPIQVVIGTPGRLLDLMNVEPKLRKRLLGLKVLIYDEADMLLDYGFQGDMTLIKNLLPPPETRQTFMFSATFSNNVKKLATDHMRPAHTLSLDTVAASQPATHLTTKQTHIQCPFSLQPQLLLHLLRHHQKTTPNSKIIVFFPTTHLTGHLNRVFNHISGLEVMQLHSAMEQRDRTRTSERFRAARTGILFTSDVSARGVDYPNVTLVLQFGVPRNVEQYIHRVGRTGRAGATGEAVLVHTRYETPFVEGALLGSAGLPLKRNVVHDPAVIARDKEALEVLREAYAKGDWGEGSSCYAAFLGYYRGFGSSLPLTGETLVQAGKEFALGLCGLPTVPKVSSGLLTRLHLSMRDGVEVESPRPVRQDTMAGEKQVGKPQEERKWEPKHESVKGRTERATMTSTLERLATLNGQSKRFLRKTPEDSNAGSPNWKKKASNRYAKKAQQGWETRGKIRK
ncbi:P-loop containing nucleoside triphosphate hydrolase protein [Chytriomyces sp. MP71]|nr:P-loop containing nucleoside triphosphate hydrolase protein [Chytriomyces sp. MP71]